MLADDTTPRIEPDDCSAGECFALRVVGQSMAPEFNEGEVIVVEPEGLARDGSYVLALHGGEFIFRQLRGEGARWWLQALNPAWPPLALDGLHQVHGVVVQKSLPGRRRASKRYI
jgi:SOS-response transcriptional repressor LexA